MNFGRPSGPSPSLSPYSNTEVGNGDERMGIGPISLQERGGQWGKRSCVIVNKLKVLKVHVSWIPSDFLIFPLII